MQIAKQSMSSQGPPLALFEMELLRGDNSGIDPYT